MKPAQFFIAKDGRVGGLNIHDTTLVAIEYNENDTLKLSMNNKIGDSATFCFIDITELNISNICNGSIVSDIFIWRVYDAPNDVSKPDGIWNTLYSSRYGSDSNACRKRMIHSSPNYFISLVSFSYGGCIACVFKRAEAFIL